MEFGTFSDTNQSKDSLGQAHRFDKKPLCIFIELFRGFTQNDCKGKSNRCLTSTTGKDKSKINGLFTVKIERLQNLYMLTVNSIVQIENNHTLY